MVVTFRVTEFTTVLALKKLIGVSLIVIGFFWGLKYLNIEFRHSRRCTTESIYFYMDSAVCLFRRKCLAGCVPQGS